MSKVYDLFMYAGEQDLLEIRLNSLKEIPHKTIILESNYSHTGLKKPLYFLENKEKFSEFSNDIIYITSDFQHENAFYVDWAGRLALFDAIPDKSSDTILLAGDLDEIPNPEKLKETIVNLTEPVANSVEYFFFCCNLWGRKDCSNIVMKYDWVKEPFFKYRDNRNKDFFKKIPDAGWHFSSIGTPEQIARKWKYFAHSSEVSDFSKNEKFIRYQIKRKAGSWSIDAKNDELKLIEVNYDTLPKYLVDHKTDKFPHLFYEYYNS